MNCVTNRDAALAALDGIANDLLSRAEEIANRNLASEAARAALLLGYMDRAFPGLSYDASSRQFLDVAIDALADSRFTPGLHGGFIEIAWVIHHLESAIFGDINVDLTDVDHVVLEVIRDRKWVYGHDLVSGLAGVGVYALERGRIADPILEAVIGQLASTVSVDARGSGWTTEPTHSRPDRVAQFPRGYLDLGVAHGICGVIPVLAGALARGIQTTVAEDLLDGAILQLVPHTTGDREFASFPAVTDGANSSPAGRVAWCYGEAGVAGALHAAARACSNPALRRQAEALARHWLGASIAEAGVRDASLCHGAAGLTQILHRMHLESNDARFGDAAAGWLAHVLSYHREDIAGGFARFVPGEDEAPAPNRSFLEGTTGIGLVLVSSLAPHVTSAWDSLLAISIPACAAPIRAGT
jgi:hypothetical protein